jgi:HPt (histidine-containing phosphotransfer) domain-containing protein
VKHIDLACIEALEKMNVSSDKNMLKLLLPIYLNSISGALEKLQSALTSLDFETLEMESHKLRSSSAAIGAIQIRDICRAIEEEVTSEKKPSQERLEQLIRNFAAFAPPTIEELNQIMQRQGS